MILDVALSKWVVYILKYIHQYIGILLVDFFFFFWVNYFDLKFICKINKGTIN